MLGCLYEVLTSITNSTCPRITNMYKVYGGQGLNSKFGKGSSEAQKTLGFARSIFPFTFSARRVFFWQKQQYVSMNQEVSSYCIFNFVFFFAVGYITSKCQSLAPGSELLFQLPYLPQLLWYWRSEEKKS